MRRALALNLTARGYRVSVAEDGTTALNAAASGAPDVIVLDLGLPDLDGMDIIRAVRGYSRTPIVVLSGRAGSGDKVDALDAGADDYVTKPFDVNELVAPPRRQRRCPHPDPHRPHRHRPSREDGDPQPPSSRLGRWRCGRCGSGCGHRRCRRGGATSSLTSKGLVT